jgi:rhomboid protease GluP
MITRPGSEPPPLFRATLPLAKPQLTYVILGALAVIWLLTEVTGGSTNSRNMVRWGANFAPLVTEGEFWRLLTANWLHFGVQHIMFNGYSLYVLGTQVESLFGPRRFMAIYLLSGVSGSLASYVLTNGLSAGASTSLFGLFGALVVFFYKQRNLLGGTSLRQLQHLGIVLLVNVVLGFLPGSNIDNWGHAGGLIGGAALAWFLAPTYIRTDPLARAFGGVLPAYKRPELANDDITDTNTIGKQGLVLGVFVVALIALSILAASAYGYSGTGSIIQP